MVLHGKLDWSRPRAPRLGSYQPHVTASPVSTCVTKVFQIWIFLLWFNMMQFEPLDYFRYLEPSISIVRGWIINHFDHRIRNWDGQSFSTSWNCVHRSQHIIINVSVQIYHSLFPLFFKFSLRFRVRFCLFQLIFKFCSTDFLDFLFDTVWDGNDCRSSGFAWVSICIFIGIERP